MRRLAAVLFVGMGLAVHVADALAAGNVVVARLRCEYMVNPLGVDVARPRLSWILQSDQRGWEQTAYQVLVAGSPEHFEAGRANIWDSGKVDSDRSIQVVYAGNKLESDTRCFWKVRVWDKDGQVSGWSESATFTTGLYKTEDWTGKWIAHRDEEQWRRKWQKNRAQEEKRGRGCNQGEQWFEDNLSELPDDPAPLMRKEFALNKPIRRAHVHVCGLGYYELYLNGGKVGDHTLDPGWTNFDQRVLYVTYDVTDALRSGNNSVGLMLGRGWYDVIWDNIWKFHTASWIGQPKAIVQMNIEYADGSHTSIVTDASWKVTGGPVLFSEVRTGEVYDARREKTGWDSPAYDDSDWENVSIAPAPKGTLRAQAVEPIKVVKVLKPVKVTEPAPGVFVFDLGQNITGRPRVKIPHGDRGKRLIVQLGSGMYGDNAYWKGAIGYAQTAPRKDGMVENGKYTGRFQQYVYTLKGRENEIAEPHFVYFGFRYIQVEGFPGKPALEDVEGLHVCTSVASAGDFSCSSDLINHVHRNIPWPQVNNMHSIPTDCPNREKLGWAGDAHVTAEEAIYNFNCPRFYTKYVHDLFDSGGADGSVPSIAPTYGWGANGGPAWAGACVVIPWHMYRYYGDTRILEEHYDRMGKWIAHMKKTRGLLPGGLGDWLPPHLDTAAPPEGMLPIAGGYYHYCCSKMSRIAAILGREEDAGKYEELAAKVKDEYNRTFFDADTSTYRGDPLCGYRQSINAMALFLGIVPHGHKDKVVENLANNILARQCRCLTTGFHGTKVLMEALPEAGRSDVAYILATQTNYPSWGWQIDRYGATTIPEWWDGAMIYGRGGTRNHPSFGSVGSYYYKYLAGIRPDSKGPGFKRIIIKPEMAENLTWAKAEYDSMHGSIASSWKKQDGVFSLEVTIPANTTATVYVPAESADRVTESGKPAAQSEGVTFIRMEDKAAVYKIKSGSYTFASQLAKPDS